MNKRNVWDVSGLWMVFTDGKGHIVYGMSMFMFYKLS